MLELQRPAEALVAADRYVALRPGDERGLRDRYDAVLATGDDAAKAAALAALMAIEPKDPDSAVRLFNAGAVKARGGDYAAAAPYFEAVTRIAPDEPRFAKAHYILALAWAQDDSKKAAARAHVEKFLQLAPDDADAKAAREMLQYLQ